MQTNDPSFDRPRSERRSVVMFNVIYARDPTGFTGYEVQQGILTGTLWTVCGDDQLPVRLDREKIGRLHATLKGATVAVDRLNELRRRNDQTVWTVAP